MSDKGDKLFFIKDVTRRIFSSRLSALAMLVVIAYLFIAISTEVYSIYCKSNKIDPIYEIGKIENRYQPPGTKSVFTCMGTDYRGRSVFWRALAGTKTAVKVGVMASLISAVIGISLGAAAGYFGGKTDDFVVWIYSTFASMPTLLFILAFALLVKDFLSPGLKAGFDSVSTALNTDPGMMAIYLGIGITGWVGLCRVVRAETMKIRETAYVQAAQSLGYNSFRIITRHVIPNLFHLVIIYFTMRFAYAIMTEVIVSYLGLGVDLEPSWGKMISDGQERLWRGVWWEIGASTGFMFLLVLSLHLLGDSLRDILDPRLKN
jgi:peptide/nickel transport system permease protein